MNIDKIKEIQLATAHPKSISVYTALLKVWIECEQDKLRIGDVVSSTEFEKDLEKAIEEGNEVGYNEGGGYNYYCEATALRGVLKVIKKHLL